MKNKANRKVSTKGLAKQVAFIKLTPSQCYLWRIHIQSCMRREIQNSLSPQHFLKLTKQCCFYCGMLPSNTTKHPAMEVIVYNGIDRLDNTKPYDNANSVPCCKLCNRMKSDLSLADFVLHTRRIAQQWSDVE